MKCGSSSMNSVDSYIRNLNSPLREIASELRALVKSSAPGIEENIKWGKPWYSKDGYICYISAAKSHITFGFAKGVRLNDPRGLLEGTGKGMRHVKVPSLSDINKTVFRGWVREAVGLNKARQKLT